MTGRFESDPVWGEVYVEEATDGAGRARLSREAEALTRARHPGVAELLEHDDNGTRARLVIRPRGTRTLADVPPLASDQVAGLGAALAQTLADLHRLGISHGGLQPGHVLLTPLGQPVLRGFDNAGLQSTSSAQQVTFDPAGDVEALADLLECVLDPVDAETRKGGSLVFLLHSATSCAMSQLAEDLARMAAPARPPLLVEGDPLDWSKDATREFWPRPPHSKPLELSGRTRRRAVLGAVLGLGAVIAGATTVAAFGRPGEATSAQAAAAAPTAPAPPAQWTEPASPTTPAPAVPSAPAASSLTVAPAAPATPSSPTTSTAPTKPPNCPTSHDEAAAVGISAACASVASANGNQVRVGNLAWVIGGPDDLAVAGDFDCDGWLDVAGLARATGDVVVFDRWAGAGQEPAGRLVRRVPSANRLVAAASGACHRLAVHRADGTPVTIDLRERN